MCCVSAVLTSPLAAWGQGSLAAGGLGKTLPRSPAIYGEKRGSWWGVGCMGGCTGCRGAGVSSVCTCSTPSCNSNVLREKLMSVKNFCGRSRCLVLPLFMGDIPSLGTAGHPGAVAARPPSQGNSKFGAKCVTSLGSICCACLGRSPAGHHHAQPFRAALGTCQCPHSQVTVQAGREEVGL